MDTTIPIKLLLRLINATPEQCAVVERLRGMNVDMGRHERKYRLGDARVRATLAC